MQVPAFAIFLSFNASESYQNKHFLSYPLTRVHSENQQRPSSGVVDAEATPTRVHSSYDPVKVRTLLIQLFDTAFTTQLAFASSLFPTKSYRLTCRMVSLQRHGLRARFKLSF